MRGFYYIIFLDSKGEDDIIFLLKKRLVVLNRRD